jgi:osmotically inducible protein OsmC
MKLHKAHAVWKGGLKDGEGVLETGSGALKGTYDVGSRFADGNTTTPEELIGAAHAGCFSMALSKVLSDDGHEPRSIETDAEVKLNTPEDGEPAIEQIRLTTNADVPGIDQKTFLRHAESSRENCVVSRALRGVEIQLEAKLR